MDLLAAIVLGLVQGATEFLPVSSSGHLELGEALLGASEPDLLFDIILHVGTLIAVCLVYRADIVSVVTGGYQGLSALVRGKGMRAALEPPGARLALLVLIASVPTAIIGLGMKKALPEVTPTIVGALLLVNAAVLVVSKTPPRHWLAPRTPLNLWRIGIAGALVIGIFQGIAVLPGLSRSGLTITVALLIGAVRVDAARFSFLLSIPAILGALILEFDPALFSDADPDRWLRYGVGALVAGVSGYLCLRLLIRLLRRAAFHHFAWYCLAVGVSAIVWDNFFR
jgi:undecaprenyl-diphosphatase